MHFDKICVPEMRVPTRCPVSVLHVLNHKVVGNCKIWGPGKAGKWCDEGAAGQLRDPSPALNLFSPRLIMHYSVDQLRKTIITNCVDFNF